ncbi:MAG TPA: hypothetical protein VIQ30_11045 [Pseudonocardia sp.]
MTQSLSGTQVVLVVADRGDLPADAIIVELGRLGVDVVRLDPALVPLHMDCALDGDRWRGQVQAGDGRTVDLDRIGAVCWRWHYSPPGHPDIADPGQRSWAAREDAHALRGVLRTLPVPCWMNHPDSLAVCENSKPVQLVHAVQAGLLVPDTLVTTSGEAATRWASDRWGDSSWDGQVVYKAFDACHWSETARLLVPARAMTAPPPDELHAAAQFQHRIHGTPVRAVLVGEQHLFAAAITDHAAETEGLDWRPRQNTTLLDWQPITLPEATVAGLRALMARWGLTYGAFDLIAPPDGGDPVWLECNPSGQWGMVETATGMPISAAIADVLAGAVTADARPAVGTGAQCLS